MSNENLTPDLPIGEFELNSSLINNVSLTLKLNDSKAFLNDVISASDAKSIASCKILSCFSTIIESGSSESIIFSHKTYSTEILFSLKYFSSLSATGRTDCSRGGGIT